VVSVKPRKRDVHRLGDLADLRFFVVHRLLHNFDLLARELFRSAGQTALAQVAFSPALVLYLGVFEIPSIGIFRERRDRQNCRSLFPAQPPISKQNALMISPKPSRIFLKCLNSYKIGVR
jgi:hypothetical protein